MGKLLNRPYSVALQQYPGLPVRDRLIAQDRFSSALESQLGGTAAVVAAFSAAGLASAPQQGHERDAALLRWSAAARMARQIGLRGLACPADAYFEVILDHTQDVDLALESVTLTRDSERGPVQTPA